MAESLSENQSLMVIARSDNQSMKESARVIVTHTRAKTELMLYKGPYTITLMDTFEVEEPIIKFLNHALDVKAK